MKYRLIFGKISKIQDSDYFVNSSSFIDSRYSNERKKDANDFKKSLEKTEINGQNFLELFEYGGISTWWFFSQETLFLKLGEIISFISNFDELLSKENITEVKITHDFIWRSIIEQLCKKFKIPVTVSFFEYSKFLSKNFLKNKLHLRQKRLKEMKNNRIKSNIKEFNSHKKIVQNIYNKVVFVSPITYRRKSYNFNSAISENREYLIDDLITIGNIKNTLGISIDYDSNPISDLILKERLESNMEWFPEEIILKSFSKSVMIFLTKYDLLLQTSQFQNLFKFQGIQFWDIIKDTFLQMKFERYLPYWLSLFDSLDNYFLKNKPKSMFVTAEGNANTLAYIFVASKHNVKTIRIQQAMITELNTEFIHDCYISEKNPFGYPIPDYMLVYGSFAKQVLIKNGYPIEKLIEFGNPTYAFMDYLEKTDKQKFYSKYKITDGMKIILFTSTKWQKDVIGEDLDPFVWEELLKHFSQKNEYFIILKPHPGENISKYEEILSNYNCKNAIIIQDGLIELIHISDVVVSNYSSVIIDATCLNKPIVELIWNSIPENPSINYHELGISIPSKIENLKFNIKNILEKQSFTSELSQKRAIFLKEQYGIPISRNEMVSKLKNFI
jgi:hypothetical protein